MIHTYFKIFAFAAPSLMTWSVYAHPPVDVANPPDHPPIEHKWEVETDTVDINGDPTPLLSDARLKWKNACEKWRLEVREDNQENMIVNLNCGTPKCSGLVGSKSCSSKGTYKIKAKRDD